MNTLLLIIIIALLVYIIYSTKKEEGNTVQEGKTQLSYHKILPEYLKKMCEITLKMPLPEIDIMFSVKGILIDVDEEWAMIEVECKKRKALKMFRINSISSIKEIV